MPQGISSHDELLRSLGDNQNTLVVIKFYDQFCRACDEIRPLYEELAQARSDDAAFFEVEVSFRPWDFGNRTGCVEEV